MTELVEESHNFVVLEKRWLVLRRFREVADQCCGWIPTSSIRIEETGLKVEIGSMTILSRARVKIQIEIADKATTFSFIIPDTEDLDIFMPSDVFSLASC